MNTVCLADKTCIPCKGGVPPLDANSCEVLLQKLGNEWSLNTDGHLYKAYQFNDFTSAMELANQITDIAEQQGHHPDLHISWGSCGVEIWTHKISGLSESDFILAAKIERLID